MEEFSFPFEPYEIQLNLMRRIKECLENRNIGIFESPTGTGKSLSVLCSTLTWLENEENRKNREIDEKMEVNKRKIEELDSSEDWVEAHRKKIEINREQDDLHEKVQKRKRISDRIEQAKKGEIDKNSRKRKTKPEEVDDLKNLLGEENDELAPDENYSSDSEVLSTFENYEQEEKDEPLKCLKIFYASRTHSQLEQLLEELEKTRFRPRVVTCAARSTLCANDDVRKLKLNHLINEKCMELRKNGGEKRTNPENGEKCKKKKCSTSCQFYNTTQIEEVVNGILANQLKNIHEVSKFGKKSQGCPYFATRKSIGVCQLVLLPYQVLLHNAAREAWGIELDENVVILDEAHNVLNTIGSLYSSEISVKSLTVALKLIREYIEVYKLRLKAKNLMYMRQLQNVTQAMLSFLNCANNQDQVMTIPQFAGKLNIAQINLFKLSTYIEKSDLCKKFHGFYMRQKKLEVAKENEPKPLSGIAKLMAKKNEEKEKDIEKEKLEETVAIPTVPSPLFSLKAFIDALNNKCEDGRIVVEKQSKFRYMLLNPADRLAEVVNSARATILVGGTMEPAQLLVETLSKGALNKQITRFSCNHVIDDAQLLSVVVDRTVDGKPFKLTYETRSNEQVLKSLAISLRALVPQLPNGVVIFVPSYDFLNMFQKKLADFGLVEKFQKPFFTESRQPTSDVWEKFSRAAKTEKGAVLMAVVGGKMSEGINFCDELGRAVVVIGLPYPNRTSVELRERMRFLDSQMKNGGNLLYESLCMHAVNQAIGRAIRHRRDYASVYLFDERFKTSKSKLSAWIGQRTLTDLSFQQILQKTKMFFETKH